MTHVAISWYMSEIVVRSSAWLRAIRQKLGQTQQQVAAASRMPQSQLSRLERSHDQRISTVRRVVQAMGGELQLIISFGDQHYRVSLTDSAQEETIRTVVGHEKDVPLLERVWKLRQRMRWLRQSEPGMECDGELIRKTVGGSGRRSG